MTNLSPAQDQQLDALLSRAKNEYQTTRAQVVDLITRWQTIPGSVKTASQQTLAALSLAGSIALNQTPSLSPAITFGDQTPAVQADQTQAEAPLAHQITQEEHELIMEKMQNFVQKQIGHLDHDNELYLEQQLSDLLNFEVTAELDGHRLNHSLGVMGSEQHLRRFPTDTLDQHDAYPEAGIAPGRGAFGWFTQNAQLTPQAIQNEKYYFAVQTLYLPDWNQNSSSLKAWYKFRKMVVINPFEKVAVVGVVGDAGPAMWVQKQFGGSPEVIREGKIWSKATRGRVILFFVDDAEDKIPLGPIDLSKLEI